jgi:cysteinyl-tRNA synthetase
LLVVGLRLLDTRTRTVRDFAPLVAGRVTMYVCGPTVQAAPHVGHARSAVAFDVLRRWLSRSGYDVIYARNVTDIDDKILAAASSTGEPWWALAERNTRAFTDAYDALGCLPPTVEPRATGHIPEQLDLIRRLIDGRRAYAAGGDVYFDVRSLPSYGELSGQRIDAMQPTEDVGCKRDVLDFALWKGAKPGEPSWETPWGPGRPGWHLECSAMATKYLGPVFDIHGGGLDLVFPHHENELAQSTAAGDGFARFWLHNGLLNLGTEKMSKSVGNSMVVAEVLRSVRAPVLRYYLGAPHYRSQLDYTQDGLDEAESAYSRIETFVRNARALVSAVETPDVKPVWDEFADAMDDDLATPRALGVVHGAVRSGNTALDAVDERALAGWLWVTQEMLQVLGLDPISQWPSAGGELQPVVDALVAVALEARDQARARRDYDSADAIRASLSKAGIVVEDTAAGVRWRLAER